MHNLTAFHKPVARQRDSEVYYVLPHGTLNPFAVVYGSGGLSPSCEIGDVVWRHVPHPPVGYTRAFVGEYTAKAGRDVDDLIVYLMAQIHSAREATADVSVVMVGWLNPMAYETPPNTRWVYNTRDMDMRPNSGTTMAQSQLNRLISQPAHTPPHDLRGSPQAPGAPRAKRSRRDRQRRQLDFEDENMYVINDDMDDEDALMAEAEEEDDDDEYSDAPLDVEERQFLIDLAMDAIRGNREYQPPHIARGQSYQLNPSTVVRGVGRFHQARMPPPLVPEEELVYVRRRGAAHQPREDDVFMNALAGQMFGLQPRPHRMAGFPVNQPTLVRVIDGVPAYQDQELAHRETPEERMRRMRASLAVTAAKTQNPGEREPECVVCRNDYASADNAGAEDRVLRLVLNGCNHEICRNCHLMVDKCPVCRIDMAGATTENSTCADCILNKATVTAGKVRMLPCEHLCLCQGCADSRVSDGNFTCPVCLENADNWRVVQ